MEGQGTLTILPPATMAATICESATRIQTNERQTVSTTWVERRSRVTRSNATDFVDVPRIAECAGRENRVLYGTTRFDGLAVDFAVLCRFRIRQWATKQVQSVASLPHFAVLPNASLSPSLSRFDSPLECERKREEPMITWGSRYAQRPPISVSLGIPGVRKEITLPRDANAVRDYYKGYETYSRGFIDEIVQAAE